MSKVDVNFIEMCRDILQTGVSSEGQIIRAKWPDGSPAHTIKKFGIINRYNLAEEFPILTLRPTNLKAVIDELLWMYQKKSNVVSELNSKVWNQWVGEDGTIGATYGYQLGVKHTYPEGEFDQVDRAIYDLKNNPYSRRIIINMYNHADLHKMNLYPCAFMLMLNVVENTLHGTLVQRSNDILTANNWDVVQYAVLMHMLAGEANLQVGELIHVINDAHIYDRHVPLVEELITREHFDAPKLVINKKPFYEYTVDDFVLENYNKGKQIRFEVAI